MRWIIITLSIYLSIFITENKSVFRSFLNLGSSFEFHMGLCSAESVLSDWWETGVGLQCRFCGFVQSFKDQDPFQTYVKVCGQPAQTGIYQCITFGKLCYRYSMFMFQKNALESALLKQKKSLDLLANVYMSCPSAYLWTSPLGLQGHHRPLGKSRYQKVRVNCTVYGLSKGKITRTEWAGVGV